MKKNLLFLLFLIPSLMLFAQSKTPTTVLIEEFTNASCGPCAAQNPDFHTLLSKNTKNVVSIKWQTAFPGVDPMNASNKTEIAARTSYYNITGVPTAVINGTTPGDDYANGAGEWQVSLGGYEGGPYGYNQAVLDFATAQPVTVGVQTNHTLNAAKDSIFITVKVNNTGTAQIGNTDLKLQVALLEQSISFPVAPGTNGEKVFYGVVRKSYPTVSGTTIDSVGANNSRTYTFKAKLPTYIYDKAQLAVVAFVQNNTSKEVFNSAISYPIGSVDASLNITSAKGPKTLCDKNEISVQGEITNGGTIAIDSLEAVVSFNGVASITKKIKTKIDAGKTVPVDFGTATLPYGATLVKIEIKNFNKNAVDFNSFNNFREQSFTVIPAVATSAEIKQDFEAVASGKQAPNTLFLDRYTTCTVVDKTVNTAATAKLGAYAKSNKSFRFDIWGAMASRVSEGRLVFYKIDLTKAKKPNLKFSWAYAQYEDPQTPATNDSLEIFVSKDCGENFESIWMKSGEDLKTITPKSTVFFPTATQWATDSVSLDQFAGKNDIMVMFQCHSDFGNNMFIDDITAAGKPIVGTNDIFENNAVSVYPNPMSEEASIEISTASNVEVGVKFFNVMGQQVATRNYGKMSGKNILPFVAGSLPNGIYTVHVQMGDKLATQKVTIQK
jgi:Outer membrane protein Omp28/Secretion system C-terminal sorting domain